MRIADRKAIADLESDVRATLTVEQAGELLGISRGLAYEAVRRGEIPSVRIGRRILVPAAALRALLGEGG